MMKRIILCLDGTWNSTYKKGKREDGVKVVKPTNVLKMARIIEPVDDEGVPQIVYYDTGVGSMSKYPGFSNRLLSKVDNYFGGAWGAGFESNIEDALTFLVNNYNPPNADNEGDEIYVMGFSRGAATARAMTQFISWMGGLPTKNDAYFLPKLFRQFVKNKGQTSSADAIQSIDAEIQLVNQSRKRKVKAPFATWQPIQIDFLGVWDSVLALGGRVINMKSREFYLGSKPADCVLNARQALGVDERRYDFLPEIWRQPSTQNQSLKQRWFAGVHSNIGGGYVNDGLANVTLHWMAEEINTICPDFKFDQSFLNKYRPFPLDELVDSKTKTYKVKDFLTRKNGTRQIVTQNDADYSQSGLDLHPSVKTRWQANPEDFRDMDEAYRPKNLKNYLEQQDLDWE